MYDMIYICQLQLGCHSVAEVQYTFTHKQYTEYKTNNTTILEECGPCPVLASYTLAFALQPRKKHDKVWQYLAEFFFESNVLHKNL